VKGTPAEWLREGAAPLDLRDRVLAAGPDALGDLVRALSDPEAIVRRRAFETLSLLLGPERVEGADRHPLKRGRLGLWVRQSARFLTAKGDRFVLP
jgi:hypothetical protein